MVFPHHYRNVLWFVRALGGSSLVSSTSNALLRGAQIMAAHFSPCSKFSFLAEWRVDIFSFLSWRVGYYVLFCFAGGSAGKESSCNAGGLCSIPGSGRSPGEGNSYPLQYSGLENSLDYLWGHKELDTTEWLSLSLLFAFAALNCFTIQNSLEFIPIESLTIIPKIFFLCWLTGLKLCQVQTG